MSVVNYLTTQGYRVAVTDGGEPKLASALPADVITRFAGLDAELLASASRIIMSPGIDPYLPVFDAARAKISRWSAIFSCSMKYVRSVKSRLWRLPAQMPKVP